MEINSVLWSHEKASTEFFFFKNRIVSTELQNSWVTRHSCSALFKQSSTGSLFVVTNVYGPSTDEYKQEFIGELRNIASLVQHPWILGGDFNLVRWMIDRSSNNVNFRLMALFNDFIRDTALLDVPLQIGATHGLTTGLDHPTQRLIGF